MFAGHLRRRVQSQSCWIYCSEHRQALEFTVCACVFVCSFMFDEPSSYLDVKQRLNAAITIRSLITPDRWAAPPHLLPILNKKTQRCTFHYNSKYFSGTSLWWSTTWVCWITSPTSSAVCTVCQVPTVWSLCRSASEKVSPFGPDVNLRCRLLRRRRWSSNQFMYQRFIPGINIFLDGYVPTENLRFRETSLVFKVAETANEEEVKRLRHYQVSDLLHLLLSPVLPVPHSVCSFPPVPWHVQDDGRVHTGDQGWRIHRLWDHGDAGRERYVFCLTSTLPTVC